MNDSNHRIQQTLHDFEALPNIEPSDAWQQSLMDRLANTQPNTDAPFPTKALMLGVVLFIGLNVGFILKETSTRLTSSRFDTSTTLDSPTLDNEREATFNTISKELFINPTSINR